MTCTSPLKQDVVEKIEAPPHRKLLKMLSSLFVKSKFVEHKPIKSFPG